MYSRTKDEVRVEVVWSSDDGGSRVCGREADDATGGGDDRSAAD